MLPFDIDVARLAKTYGYIGVAGIVALESLGVPIPGETALVAAAVYAGTTHNLNIEVIILVATIGATIGGSGGYWLGRHLGFPLLKRYGHYLGLNDGRLKVAHYLFQNHGGKVVFWGRFVAFLRAFASILAGANGMAWRHFMVVNALGGFVWAVTFGVLSYDLGKSAERIFDNFGLLALAVGVFVIAATLIFFHRHEQMLVAKVEELFPGPLTLDPPAKP